jgi:hypothetical protein
VITIIILFIGIIITPTTAQISLKVASGGESDGGSSGDDGGFDDEKETKGKELIATM